MRCYERHIARGQARQGAAEVDRVYSDPEEATRSASSVLADPAASTQDRGEALWALGRVALYQNQISDATRYLREALPMTSDRSRVVDIVLSLALAVSKEGHANEALKLLGDLGDDLTPNQSGLVHNQMGLILLGLGKLVEAHTEMMAAQQFLQASGDSAGEARALVNLGAIASIMGRLEEAESWYRDAQRLTHATGQLVVAAAIEGNIGYVTSRRGDFASAIAWYDRARAGFEGFGDVSLLVATLECDYASTLLDVGLDSDAVDAAQFAVDSSKDGANKVQEIQSRLLLAEAELRLGLYDRARRNLLTARADAAQAASSAWVMRADYFLLRWRIESGQGMSHELLVEAQAAVGSMRLAGWEREALEISTYAAEKLWADGRIEHAEDLLSSALRSGDDTCVDPIDRAYAKALLANWRNDRVTEAEAVTEGMDQLAREQALVSSTEMRVRLGRRGTSLRNLAMRAALADADPLAVAVASDLGRTPAGPASGRQREINSEQLAQLRDARIGLREAQLSDGDLALARTKLQQLEHDVLHARRVSTTTTTPGVEPPPLPRLEIAHLQATLADRTLVTYVANAERLWAARFTGDQAEVIDLGELAVVASLLRAQRSALRRLVGNTGAHNVLASLAETNRALEQLLIQPIRPDETATITLVPGRALGTMSWAACPTLVTKPFTIAPSIQGWLGHRGEAEPTIDLRNKPHPSVGLVAGPGLRQSHAELVSLSSIWADADGHIEPASTAAQAMTALQSHDIVHVAAHGTFRTDNPSFSSLEFVDGPLTILDLEGLQRCPTLVVLASCDAAAGAGNSGDDMVGTTAALLGVGVGAVIAPTVLVNDVATRYFSEDLHRGLAARQSPEHALLSARHRALARGSVGDVAAAFSFHLHGSHWAATRV